MNVFLLDLWHDLREKRLAPVAVLLALALAAVPFVLRKSTEPAPVAPVAAGSPSEDAQKNLAVKALQQSELPSSDLGVFDPRNPFKPLGGGASTPSADDGKAGVPDSGDGASGGKAGGSGDATSAQASKEDGGGGGGDTGGNGGGGGGGGQTAPRQTTQRYTYVVDVTFRRNNRTRRIKGMRRLDMLPSQESPLLIFLGVSGRGGNAVFLVDSSLTGDGEGTCKPSKKDCSFLYLGAGSEHEFTSDEGESLNLRVDQIRRVKLRAVQAGKSRKPKRPARPKASVQTRRFVLSDLIDVVDVASSESDSSSGGGARR